jgi:hypothetical protein
MIVHTRSVRRIVAVALACAACVAVAGGAGDYRNVTAGGSLRAGVYGRIEVRGNAAPPPLIYPEPVLANSTIERVRRRPVYLYVPPGQVRKWKQNCARWSACDVPVLFVRMDRSPSRWGAWHLRREQLAGEPHEHPH